MTEEFVSVRRLTARFRLAQLACLVKSILLFAKFAAIADTRDKRVEA